MIPVVEDGDIVELGIRGLVVAVTMGTVSVPLVQWICVTFWKHVGSVNGEQARKDKQNCNAAA